MMERKRPKRGSDATEGRAVETATPAISLKPQQVESDRDILVRLRPIVLHVEDHADLESLCGRIGEMEFLQMNNSTSLSKGEILNELYDIYAQARRREAAALVPAGYGEKISIQARETAIEIRNAILYSELEDIANGEGLKVYRGFVPNVQRSRGGEHTRVVVRPEDQAFWHRCIELCLENRPVCGVGSPGIGKTTTSLYLLQQVVCQRCEPIVYTILQKEAVKNIFYEFTPVVESGQLKDVDVQIYRAYTDEKYHVIPSMNKRDAFFFVDPGNTKHSCDDSNEDYYARFLMAASNDRRHWGGNEFTKYRGSHGAPPGLANRVRASNSEAGKFVYGSLWTDRQLMIAKPFLEGLRELSDREVLRRFRIVGGSLGDILEFNEVAFEQKVQAALDLESTIVQELAEGFHRFAFDPEMPSNALIALGPKDQNMNVFKITLKSDYIEECFAAKYLRMAWYVGLDEENAGNRGNLFESYLRALLSQRSANFSSNDARESKRELPQNKNETKNYQPVDAVAVGSNRTIVRVSDMCRAVRNDQTQQHMFYSKNESEPLIDMIYRVDDGFESVQATIRKNHNADAAKIQKLKSDLNLGNDEYLKIFYAIPATRFKDFVTDPVNPLLGHNHLDNVSIFHIGVSDAFDQQQ